MCVLNVDEIQYWHSLLQTAFYYSCLYIIIKIFVAIFKYLLAFIWESICIWFNSYFLGITLLLLLSHPQQPRPRVILILWYTPKHIATAGDKASLSSLLTLV